MCSVLSSKKGIENAPFFLIFAALVLTVTASLAFYTMGEWNKINDRGRTLNEAKRISQACEEIKFAGDVGSATELKVAVPQKCSILVGSDGFTASCKFDGESYSEIVPTKVKITGSNIPGGSYTVRIIYSTKAGTAQTGTHVLYVS